MEKKKISLSKVILFLFLTSIILILCYRYFVLLPKVQKQGKFTIGTVIDWSAKKGGAYNIYFTYEVKGQKYEEYSNASYEAIKRLRKNSRFLVVYLEGDFLSKSGIILENPVPDSVRVAPYDGWQKKPVWAK